MSRRRAQRATPPGPFRELPARSSDVIERVFTDGRHLVTTSTANNPFGDGVVTRIVISRRSGERLGWADLQAVKNELMGPDVEAIQFFPAATDVVDIANCYHLWCLPAGQRIEIGECL